MKILNTTNLNELRKQVQVLKKSNKDKEQIAVMSQDDEFNRKALEIKGINIFIINEELNKKDYSKQRNSDLNEVLAKLAAKNNVEIGIEIDNIIKKSDTDKAKSLARLSQNIMLCKKAKTKLVLVSKSKRARDLSAVLLVLGASTPQTKPSQKF